MVQRGEREQFGGGRAVSVHHRSARDGLLFLTAEGKKKREREGKMARIHGYVHG